MHKNIRNHRILVLDPITIDARLKKLDSIKGDIEAAVEAVTEIQRDARLSKEKTESLQKEIIALKADKEAADAMLQAPRDSVVKFLGAAISNDRRQGRIEGVLIGLLTGALSSWAIWFLTTPPAAK